jgi:hypothetical protein
VNKFVRRMQHPHFDLTTRKWVYSRIYRNKVIPLLHHGYLVWL